MQTRKERSLTRDRRKALTPKGKEILSAYLQAISKLKRYPKRADIILLGYNREVVRDHFGSFDRLKEYVSKNYPEAIESIIEDRIKSPRKQAELDKTIKNCKRFVITSAVEGSAIHKGFRKSIAVYCKKNKAELLIMPSGKSLEFMDQALAEEHWILKDTYLNSNLWLCSMKIPPKSAQPTDKLKRIGQRDGSLIAASPKQFLQFVAVGNERLAHAVMSTGAITVPNYSSKSGVSCTDYIANHDHVLGAIIVEIVDDKSYHFRQIQSDENGVFYSLGVKYSPKGHKLEAPVGMLWGDLHSGEVDESAKKANFEIMDETKVEKVYLGDAFGGISINHHEEHDKLKRAILAGQNKMDLGAEIKALCEEINAISSKSYVKEIVIVDSNHHDFLSKHYLSEGKYIDEPQNYFLAHELVSAMGKGWNPLQYACEKLYGLKNPDKVKWLKIDADDRIADVQMGAHGHKGANGSKGSKRTLEEAYGNAMHGHTHSPYIFRGIFCVGTTSVLRPGFNTGPSGWVHCSGNVYKNGMRELINSFNGNWRLKDK
jgi:hypothetical protein